MPGDRSQTGLILASFGAGPPPALEGVANVLRRAEAAFPGRTVELAFSSQLLRAAWRKRAGDAEWVREHPEAPPQVYRVRSLLGALGEMAEREVSRVVVQPLQLTAGEEYRDIALLVEALAALPTLRADRRPFPALALGRPALGRPDPAHPYLEDMARAARVLAPDIQEAAEAGAGLVYVGHGNALSPGGYYRALEDELRRRQPGALVRIGLLRSRPNLEDIIPELRARGLERVLLKPLLLSAGGHAQKDIFGGEESSCKSVLEKEGLEVIRRMEGLGERDAWADIYLDHARDAAREAGFSLD